MCYLMKFRSSHQFTMFEKLPKVGASETAFD